MSHSLESLSPVVRRVRAYFAPVDRVTKHPTLFDPAQSGSFVTSPPAPWIDLGWINDFKRTSGTKVEAVRVGAPATTYLQARTEIDATLSFSFQSWGKLQLSLSAGTQQLNLLKPATISTGEPSGGLAVPAISLQAGSTATVLQLGPAAVSAFAVGEWIAVDVDYTGQTGFVGSCVSGAYVKAALTDVDYVRRVTLNVGKIVSMNAGTVTLQSPLLAGVPASSMKVSGLIGFCDREGSSFFQEWSALFVCEGQQGEHVLWYYPRLQAMSGIAETITAAAGGYETVMLSAQLRALPVNDPVDGETVVCFRSYIAA